MCLVLTLWSISLMQIHREADLIVKKYTQLENKNLYLY